METISNEVFAAARARAGCCREQSVKNVLLRHIANGVMIESRTVEIDESVVIAPGSKDPVRHHPAGQNRHRRGLRHRPQQPH